ncbi:MAG: coproporphyrinogen dehydrogenase HemZ [Ruminococcus sp.]|nr:coproporphyrinogen dehydrogenase HemZ [Ruminococcus sp.]
MNLNNEKMPIILIGNTFKYEIEATVKLFIGASRFNFYYEIPENFSADEYIIAEIESNTLKCRIKLDGKEISLEKILSENEINERSVAEHELCRLIYTALKQLTRIVPPWGLLTGIRPVKKVTALVQQGLNKNEINEILTKKYEISPSKLELAFHTAYNQLPILEKINKKAVSLYISIPFCPTRCSYCSFVSHSMDSAMKLIPDYIQKLCDELKIIGNIVKETNTEIDTIYFGGGTPTSISAEYIEVLMECVKDNFDIASVREYNFEAGRADTITREKLEIIKKYGATRISVNPQTLNDDVLKVIGRLHTGEDTINAFKTAREVGFDNINMDLIAGLPSETSESFKNSLDKIIDLNPESITVHTLTLKRSASLYESGKSHIGNPVADMVDYSVERLMSNGYNPYYLYRQKNTVDNLENVGYSKKGAESYYNIYIMDETQTILGAGCAASTKLVYPDGKISRIHNYKFPYEYINRFEQMIEKKKEVIECLKKIKDMKL